MLSFSTTIVSPGLSCISIPIIKAVRPFGSTVKVVRSLVLSNTDWYLHWGCRYTPNYIKIVIDSKENRSPFACPGKGIEIE